MPTTDATARDIITLALKACGSAAAADVPAAEDMQFAFDICNGMLDSMAVDRLNIYNVSFDEYALTAGQQDYDIGPGATAPFDLDVRPSRIVSAQLVIPGSPDVRPPLAMLDDDDWARLVVQDVGPDYPTAVYYTPSWPEGLLQFWPKPQGGLEVRLETWNQFAQFVDMDTAFSFPQGYYELIWTNLAERLCIPAFGMDVVPESVRTAAARARARVESNNMNPPARMVPDCGVGGIRNDNYGYRNLYQPSPLWYR